MTEPRDKGTISRRQLLSSGVRLGCGAALAGAVVGLTVAGPARAVALRPPGALVEDEFLGACLRCNLCVQACPYQVLRPAERRDGAALGTPVFVARDNPCQMCEDIPCATACPSGALALKDINRAHMGVAVLVGHETCLNYLGLRCDVCYRTCPRIDAALTLELRHNERTGKHAFFIPTVHTDQCTGCGQCEKACVLDTPAIKVLPAKLALAGGDGHYRLGWREKAKAGKPLVDGIIELPHRMPEAGQ